MSDNTADRIALQDVMLRYAAGVDERDFEMYASCFADDVVVEGFGDATVNGREAWVDYVKNALERFNATQHMLGPQMATVDGDVAQTRSDVQALHYTKDPADHILTLWATYNTEMTRINGEWKITRHRLASRGTKVEPA